MVLELEDVEGSITDLKNPPKTRNHNPVEEQETQLFDNIDYKEKFGPL